VILVGQTEARGAAKYGVFLTSRAIQRDDEEALTAGYYHSSGWVRGLSTIKIITVGELLDKTRRAGIKILTFWYGCFKQESATSLSHPVVM